MSDTELLDVESWCGFIGETIVQAEVMGPEDHQLNSSGKYQWPHKES